MTRLERALSIADLRDLARRRLPASVFEFIDGGAEDEHRLERAQPLEEGALRYGDLISL